MRVAVALLVRARVIPLCCCYKALVLAFLVGRLALFAGIIIVESLCSVKCCCSRCWAATVNQLPPGAHLSGMDVLRRCRLGRPTLLCRPSSSCGAQ